MLILKSYLQGEWREGKGEGAILVNPSTEDPLAQATTEGLDLKEALRYAREKGGPALRAMSFAERGNILKAMSKALSEIRDSLVAASLENAGTTVPDARFDIDGATGTLAYYAGLGKKLGDQTFLVEPEVEQLTKWPNFSAQHIKTPLRGVAVHINAFNFPAWGLGEKAAVSLLAGIPVIAKPAASTSLLAYRVMDRLVESKVLPDGALQFICGGVGDMLSAMSSEDVLSFTGSGTTGTYLRGLKNVVARNIRVNVEADSLNAVILGADVIPESPTYQMFLRDTVREITQKTGQKCTATRRIFVPKAMIERVQSDLSEKLANIKVGNPAAEDVEMGPLATAQQRIDARAGIAKLTSSGARIVFGDPFNCNAIGAPTGKGFFLSPILLRADDPSNATLVHSHEVFGPVATLMPYQTEQEAVSLVALGDGCLVSSLYSDDLIRIQEIFLGIAHYHGRVFLGSADVVDQATTPGMVMPSCLHGGPGRAGGGLELGGLRGLDFYMQRTAVQGDKNILAKLFPIKST
jgi:3,4-dehydroadipyl-CoA semialdehyde dehydrogenase